MASDRINKIPKQENRISRGFNEGIPNERGDISSSIYLIRAICDCVFAHKWGLRGNGVSFDEKMFCVENKDFSERVIVSEIVAGEL